MALKKTVTTLQGLEASDAYHRVENLLITSKDSMSFTIRSYKEANRFPVFAESQHTTQYDIEGANPIAQAYAFAKTLAEFSNVGLRIDA